MKEVDVTTLESSFAYGPPDTSERNTSYPSTVEVLAVQARSIEWATEADPLPDAEIVAGEFVALLTTVTVPEKPPDETGRNVSSRVADCPGVRMSPAETPLVEYPVPETPTFEMVTFEFPALVSVTPSMLLFPIATEPKFKVEVDIVSSALAAIPVPLTVTMSGVAEASLTIETPPESAPADLGANITSREARLPGAIVSGNETPVTVTPAAVALALLIVMLVGPSFVMVTDWDAVEPSGTEPNLIAVGATDIEAALVVPCWLLEETFGAPVTPMQPETAVSEQIKRMRAARDITFRPAEVPELAQFRALKLWSNVVLLFIAGNCAVGRFGGTTVPAYIYGTVQNLSRRSGA